MGGDGVGSRQSVDRPLIFYCWWFFSESLVSVASVSEPARFLNLQRPNNLDPNWGRAVLRCEVRIVAPSVSGSG